MDQSSTATLSSTLALRLKNCVASAAVVAMALAFHYVSASNRRFLAQLYGSEAFSFTGAQFLFSAALMYTALVAVYFFIDREPAISKSLRFWQLAAIFVRAPRFALRGGLSRADRLAVLATLLKALFGPLMTMATMTAAMGLLANVTALANADLSVYGFREVFDRQGFWLIFHCIVLVDVLVFAVGYLVELPRLRNEIRSVDPTLLGWAAALVCYSPFNVVLGMFLGPPGTEFPRFDNATVHLALNFLLLGLMAIYSWASVALGFKASNLTHRGIVAHGPYRFVRHPAYACKNMAWWIGSVPAVTIAFGQSMTAGAQALASVVGWTLLYVLRAVTEEDHLRSVDGDYAAYAATVRYRFIPGVL